ncbi:MAG: S-formylglutathione hydrolase [Pseudomonadota bacterium]
MQIVSQERCFGGVQGVYDHRSAATSTSMRFAVFVPEHKEGERLPVLTWLSGLTCNEQNFITKSGMQALAARFGVIVVSPDTSPRGDGVPDDKNGAYDFGLGAGFYVDACVQPWAKHYQMRRYVLEDLQTCIAENFPIDTDRQGIFGHSMGGHGALTLHLNHPDLYRSISAFAPIVAPSQVPWGRKALAGYLGDDESTWAQYDATALVVKQPSKAEILIDQGGADDFLTEHLRPELFAAACQQSGQALTLNRRAGYSHSYYFIATFLDRHFEHHAQALS